MKATNWLASFGVTMALLAGTNAYGYFNPQVGKWASRDPVEEPGFMVLAQGLTTEGASTATDDEGGLATPRTADVALNYDIAAASELSDALAIGDFNHYTFSQNDPTDKIDALGLEVYIQAHPVFAGFHHSKVTMEVECGSRWIGDPRFHPMPGESGRYYATIGAGPVHHLLVSGVNRPRDVQLWRNIFSARVSAPAGTSDDDFIGELLTANSRYPNNLPYAAFPRRHGRHYNSNGYASGILLFVAGSMPPRPPRTPGFKHPVPAEDFR